jgi:hypothetical protein
MHILVERCGDCLTAAIDFRQSDRLKAKTRECDFKLIPSKAMMMSMVICTGRIWARQDAPQARMAAINPQTPRICITRFSCRQARATPFRWPLSATVSFENARRPPSQVRRRRLCRGR